MRGLAVSGGAGLLVLVLACCAPLTARAEFTQASLLSGTALLQFEVATAPALSADDQYAVFQGVLAGVPGVYRRDLRTGQVEMVAGGDSADPENMCETGTHPLASCDAAAPSISADGRYVAFTTTADLEPEHTLPGASEPVGEPPGDSNCPEVYVRDMELAPGAPGAYTLASALNGSGEGITYVGGCTTPPSAGFVIAGAQAAPAVALSADGRHVVFTVLSASDIAGRATESAPSQVAVRDLETDTTTLISATPNGEATPKGGAFPSADSEGHIDENVGPQDSTAFTYGDQPTASSASISADGSTVAWLGTNVPAQVPGSAEELAVGTAAHFAEREPLGSEAEPLWRRVAGGPTLRLLAGAGLNFFYIVVAESGDPVLTGSLVGEHNLVFVPPALSADGDAVGVLASAPTPAGEATFQRSGLSSLSTDAYVVHVGASPESPPAVTALTEIPDYAGPRAAVEDVKDIAISLDGTKVAFDTARTQFALPSLALISPPTTFTDHAETYEANLALGTLQRVTTTYSGAEPNGPAGLLAFSGDGEQLAFASQATNLFFGDAIDASEVYAARELPDQATPAAQEIGAAPPLAPAVGQWTLSATAIPEADGSVLVVAQTPGAGRLVVKAGTQLPPPPGRPGPRSAHHAGAHKAARASAARANGKKQVGKKRVGKKRAKGKDKPGGGPGVAVPARTVAQASKTTATAAEVRLRLRVSPAYEALVAGGNGLYAVLRMTFAAPGHRTLVTEVPVTFRLSKHKSAARKPSVRKRVER